jgi:hypothetical protein
LWLAGELVLWRKYKNIECTQLLGDFAVIIIALVRTFVSFGCRCGYGLCFFGAAAVVAGFFVALPLWLLRVGSAKIIDG